MGSFETGVADNMLIDAAERIVTANINLDWEKAESHVDLERMAQDIEVEAYCAQRRIAEALHKIGSLMKAQSRIKTIMASVEGEVFEKRYADLHVVDERLALVTSDLQNYLKGVFGSVIDPMMAIRLIAQAKKDLLRHAEEIAETIPGYEMIKTNDAGRSVTSPTMGKGHVMHVDPDRVLIAWENGQEQWVTQEELATADVKMGDESGTAVQADDGAMQGPSDNPEGTIGMADRERNPLMDYLQGYELEEEEQEGMKKAPVSKPAPSKMTMSAGVDYPTDKPGATKSNPQEPETLNPTPKKIKYRLEALDELTKTWKEVGVYDSMEKANEKSDAMKEELPMTMETKVTPLVGLDKDGKPDYQTTPKGPEGDNTEQTVKEVKAADEYEDINANKPGARYCSTCDQWIPAGSGLGKDKTGCPGCWGTTMTKEEKMETESSQKKVAVAPEGWEGTVKKLKKHKDKVDNPWALAWWMKGEGYKPGGKKKSSLNYHNGAWELWLESDQESPIVSQDPAVIAYVTAGKMNWSLKKASAIMRYVKDLDMPFVIYEGK